MEKKKILFVINTMGQAGAEAALTELLRCLNPDTYELSLYVMLPQGPMFEHLPDYVRILNKQYSLVSVLEPEGERLMAKQVVRNGMRNGSFVRNAFYMAKNAVPMLKKHNIMADKLLWKAVADGADRFEETFDLAVAFIEGASTYYVANHVKAKRKAAFVHTNYGLAGYTRDLDQNCYRRFHRIFAISEAVRLAFLEMYPEYEKRVKLFYNIVNQDRIRRKAKEPGGFQDGYDGLRILTVGRLTAPKAYEISIDAMKLLKEDGRKVRWYVLGEGNQRKLLEAQIDRLGLQEDFILVGAVDNPYPYYAQTDLYVHASRYEGKSIAIQEAQTLGCPMVVSNVMGNREQVAQGTDGLICELTPQDIHDGIASLLDDPEKRKRLGEKAAEKKISSQREINKLLCLLSR